MRIIGGDLAGRPIPESKFFSSRPTTDLAKESLFNMLNNDYYFDELSVLDMFAGTGSISYEFASRGTTKVIALDISTKHIDFIRKTAEYFGLSSVIPLHADAFKFIEESNQQFDIIFADPPYDMPGIDKIPDFIFNKNAIKPEGMLILEHSAKNNFKNHPRFKKEKKYGKVHISFFSI
jgi:16S rRNA (guanine(966)-N(2))-methyltransferase RsmD